MKKNTVPVIRIIIFGFLLLGNIIHFACSENEQIQTNPRPLKHTSPTDKPNIYPSYITTDVPIYKYKIINVYPHDPNSFTQGLVYENGTLYEGTGLKGKSTLKRVDLLSGAPLQVHQLPKTIFGEGITIFQNKIIQLSWRSNVCFVYDKETFQLLKQFNYPNEGWGITSDDKNLIMSDGSKTLTFLDPITFKKIKTIDVYSSQKRVKNLNELEYINGEIYANIWKSDFIVKINPSTGKVTGWIDLRNLLTQVERKRTDVLNGIAYDNEKNRLFVTGKLWPKLFEIELIQNPYN